MDPAAAESTRHVRPAEAARRLGLSECTVRREIRAGRLEARKFGRAVLIPVEALDRLVRGRA